jgi:hypothetical protein
MAQTKKQRFREQKRAKKAPAPKPPVAKAAKVTDDSGNGKKKVIIGVSALVALAGVAGTVLLLANPFASPEPTAAASPPATAPPVVVDEMTPSLIRSMLIREYRVRVEQSLAGQIFASCDSGKGVSGSGTIRGEATPVTVTCVGTKLTVVNSSTNAEIPPAG